jgi:hypothetical protein
MDIKGLIIENAENQRKAHQILYLRQSASDGCTRYRQDIPIKALANNCQEFNIGAPDKITTANFFFADLIEGLQILKTMTGQYPLWELVANARCKMSLDYNDDIFSIPVSNPASIDAEVLEGCHEMIAHADALTVTTTPMKQTILRDNANVAIIPNYFDMATYLALFVDANEAEARWRERGKKTIVGYVGSANHTEDQDIFFNAIAPIMRERADVEMAIMGFCSERWKNEFGARIHEQKFHPLNEYFIAFRNLEMDILCAPVMKNGFNTCKSNIKWLEGSYMGATIISSPIPSFEDLGTDMCSIVPWDKEPEIESHAWRVQIEHMIDCPTERFEMLDRSQRWMVDEWDISKGWVHWRDYFRAVLNGESVGNIDHTPRRVKG